MIKVSTCALILNESGQLWLMRRTPKCRDEHGRWDTCAGTLEYGLTAEENMRKELLEELGVRPHVLEFIGYRDVFRKGADSAHYVGLDFIARVQSADVSRQEPLKHDQGGWFTVTTLPSPLHSQIIVWLDKYAAWLT